MNKLPGWFKQEIPDARVLNIAARLSESGIRTVCQEARCPNLSYCFKHLKFTFMILGDTCTRNCRFCAVNKSRDKNLTLDLTEPLRIAEVVKRLGLDYVVITSVTRDDLKDGGASIFAETIELIHALNASIKTEVLIPDFKADRSSLKCILDANPSVVAHNIETVRRLHKDLRPMADYQISLEVLRILKELRPQISTKSSIMLGLGEREQEVIDTMKDLKESSADLLTLGQYLAPTLSHYPVSEFISIEQFQNYQRSALNLGFKSVLSGPLVRSSYKAEGAYKEFVYA